MDLVDRNIRQRMLPFVWNPADDINSKEAQELNNNSLKTVWTFRRKEKFIGSAENPKIGITPEDHGWFNKDMANQLVFGVSGDNMIRGSDFDLETLMDFIPAIQIREYTQDTRLDLVLSFVDYLVKGFKDGKAAADKLSEPGSLAALTELLAYDLKNVSDNKYWKQIIDLFKTALETSDPLFYEEKNPLRQCVLDLVHAMYYRILTTTTTNIYTLPYSSDHVSKGNGFTGFDDGFDIGSKMDDSASPLLKFIAPNITITTTPMWRGMRGGESVSIEITFNLFNDELDKSIRNFIFVNTILPQNLPTQYAIFSQPPSLYDIKIEGGNRLFMCAGNFNCIYKGVMRQPSNAFFDGLNKHVNTVIFKAKQEAEKKTDENVQESKNNVKAAQEKVDEAQKKVEEAQKEHAAAQDKVLEATGSSDEDEIASVHREMDNAYDKVIEAEGKLKAAEEELDKANKEFENNSKIANDAKDKTAGAKKDFIEVLKKNDCIKIPDVYEITMSFKSLLPNNFNNFLSQYAMNSNMSGSSLVINRMGVMDGDSNVNDKMVGIIGEWIKARSADAVELAKFKSEYDSQLQNEYSEVSLDKEDHPDYAELEVERKANIVDEAYEAKKNELLNKGNTPTN